MRIYSQKFNNFTGKRKYFTVFAYIIGTYLVMV